MRAPLFALALFSAAAGALALADDLPVRVVDVARSHATFSVTHLYLTRVTGTVPISSGSVMLRPNSAIPIAIAATLDPRKIATGDGDRDDDLQGADWFDTKRFATWTFASSSVTPKTENTFAVAGALTTHGVAQPLTLEVTTTHDLPQPSYHAVGHIDRHGFGMRVTPTDGLIGSDVTLTLDVQLR